MRNLLLLLFAGMSAPAVFAQTGNVGIGTTNPQSQLHTTGSVRHAVLKGPGSRPVYADDSGRLMVTSRVFSNDTAQTIPQLQTCESAVRNIQVSGVDSGVLSKNIQVRVNIDHPSTGELVLVLRSPAGQYLILFEPPSNTGEDLTNTVFSDDASNPVLSGIAPYTGLYKPVGGAVYICGFTSAQAVSTFSGFGSGTTNPNGTWQLYVFDVAAPGSGTLLNWSISFDGIATTLSPLSANRVPRATAAGFLTDGTIYDANGRIGLGTTNPQSQLHTTARVQHDTLAGAGARPVYADAQGRMFTVQPPNTSSAPTAQIPDNACASGNGVSSSISISGEDSSTAPANIRVRVDISHTYDADLHVFVISPMGDTLRLVGDNGGSGQNFTNTVFWDGAPAALPTGNATGAPFAGVYKPTGGLFQECNIAPDVTTFGGMGGGTINPNGIWKLLLFDNYAQDVGRLNSWGITFNGSNPLVPGPAVVAANVVPKSNGYNLVGSNISELNGNVGIGVLSQSIPLYVRSNNALQLALQTDNPFGTAATLYNSGAGGKQWDFVSTGGSDSAGAGKLIVRVYSNPFATVATFQPNGNVGIGTAAPAQRLHLSSGGATTALVEGTSGNSNVALNLKTPNNHFSLAAIGGASFYGFSIYDVKKNADRLVIDSNGNVSIGTATPAGRLDVRDNADGLARSTFRNNSTGANARQDLQIGANISSLYLGVDNGSGIFGAGAKAYLDNQSGGPLFFGTVGAEQMRIAANGNVSIGSFTGSTAKLAVNGTAEKQGGGTWGTLSDARVKKNVRDYSAGLKEILALHPVSFQYNNLSGYDDTARRFVGVIAQEIEQVLPSTVSVTNDDPRVKDKRQYDGSELTYTLINAIRDLHAVVAAQQAEIASLKQENASVKSTASDVAELKAALKELQQTFAIKSGAETVKR